MEESRRNGTGFLQWEQVNSLLLSREVIESVISDSQTLHLSIIPDMKPLILILLASAAVEAQSIADVARQERARQARVQSTRVITTEDVRRGTTGTSQTPAPAAPAAQAPAPAAAKPPVDPVQQYNETVAQIRSRIRQLQDEETATQLQINDVTNRVFAPVTTQSARNQAQTELAGAQKKLADVRTELAANRTRLQQMEAQGPPK
jgi:hypothetical protein